MRGATWFYYVARRVGMAFLAAALAVFLLIFIADLIELLRRANGPEAPGLGKLAGMALLHAPSVMRLSLPFVMLLASLWAYGALARRSEIVAAQAAGASFARVAAPGAAAAGLIGLTALLAFDPLSAAALERYDRLNARYFKGPDSLLSVEGGGVWLRERMEGGAQMVISAASADSAGRELRGATFFEMSPDDRFIRRYDAESARLEEGFWRLKGGVLRAPPGGGALDVAYEERLPEYLLPTRLTLAQIQDGFSPPESISVWRLPGFIRNLEAAGFAARRHRTHFYAALASPLMFAAMALIAAAFAARPPRLSSAGLAAAGGAATGFALYFLGDVAQALGGSGAAPPLLAAVAPALSAALAGLALAAYRQGA